MDQAIIWGTGDIARRLKTMKQEYSVVAYTDSNPQKWGVDNFDEWNAPVISPDKIGDYTFDYIIIANIYDYREIYLRLVNEYGVAEDKIKNFSQYIAVNFSEYNCGDIRAENRSANFADALKNGDIELNNDLERIVFSEENYIITKYLHYFEIYNKHFERFRNQKVSILEIGVYKGGSLHMWKEYFGEHATIVGIDINSQCKQYEGERINIEIGSQSDEKFLEYVVSKYGPFDIIVDDGSHSCSDQIESFRVLFDSLKDDGIYLCEDVLTSYDSEWGGGYLETKSFIEYSKKIIDYIHGYHIKNRVEAFNYYTENVFAVHYYNNIVVIEKRKMPAPLIFVGNKNFFHIPMANTLKEEKEA